MAGSEFPLVTVITPTYNRADLLPETVESILAQDYPNFEYLVLDDGSTDNTREVIARYDDPRLSYHYHDNLGVVRTVNKGFTMARGEYIVHVNSDDPLLPGYMAQMVAFLQAHPDIVGAYPDWLMIDEASQPMKTITVAEYDPIVSLKDLHTLQGPGTMLRRSALDIMPGYDPTFPTIFDHDFYTRVGLSRPFKRLPAVLATYREHSQTLTNLKTGHKTTEHIDWARAFFQSADLPDQVRQIKRSTFSVAHYKAAMFGRQHRRWAGYHFLMSILYCPFGCTPNGQARRWRFMLRVIFVPRWVELIGVWAKRRVLQVLKR